MTSLVDIVDSYNPTWDASDTDAAARDQAFFAAADVVSGFLSRAVAQSHARINAHEHVLRCHAVSADERILELDRGLPWKNVVILENLPILFAIYPSASTGWMVDTMPPSLGSFEQRMPLPEAWAGLRDEELVAASDVEDAVFMHPGRFCGGARSREGALALARKSLEIGLAAALASDPNRSSATTASI